VDDPAIQGGLRLLRRVPKFLVHGGKIEKTCFEEREEGSGLSVTAWKSPSDLDDIRRFHEEFGVVCVRAEVFRQFEVTIAPAPLVGNLNHYEIFPRLTPGQRKKLRAAATWVHYPDWVAAEDRGQPEVF